MLPDMAQNRRRWSSCCEFSFYFVIKVRGTSLAEKILVLFYLCFKQKASHINAFTLTYLSIFIYRFFITLTFLSLSLYNLTAQNIFIVVLICTNMYVNKWLSPDDRVLKERMAMNFDCVYRLSSSNPHYRLNKSRYLAIYWQM